MRKVNKGNVTIKVHIICDSERVCEGGGGCTVVSVFGVPVCSVYVKGGEGVLWCLYVKGGGGCTVVSVFSVPVCRILVAETQTVYSTLAGR